MPKSKPKPNQDSDVNIAVVDCADRDALYLARLRDRLADLYFFEEDILQIVVAAASNLPDFDEVCEDCAEGGNK